MSETLSAESTAFGLQQISERARQLAEKPYEEPQKIPASLTDISYDEYRSMRFNPEMALWKGSGLNYHVEFFHPGLYYTSPVEINILDSQSIQPYAFDKQSFTYDDENLADRVPEDLGYAGFRLTYPVRTPDTYNQVIVFAGASYFRAVGRDQGFGLSARGLAVDTALPSGEEFPYFREFWLEKPAPEATEMVVYALLDSRRISGAYKFTIHPGLTTTVDVEAQLFWRDEIEVVGVAPLTSMFFYGEERPRPETQWRDEIHDSDGLLIDTTYGERIWRPLVNPRRLLVSEFSLENPKGFGLMQRDRDYSHYQDLEARYEIRPSAWVEPVGDWGKGGVRLVQIPTDDETNDNIVAFWVPEAVPEKGEPLAISYKLHWQGPEARHSDTGIVTATRQARLEDSDRIQFVVDFAGDNLAQLAEDANLEGMVSVNEGEIRNVTVQKNPLTSEWRLAFKLKPPSQPTVELRANLALDGNVLTETWSYLHEL